MRSFAGEATSPVAYRSANGLAITPAERSRSPFSESSGPQELGTFGNLGRNTVIGPGLSTVDFLVNKHFRISEGQELQFRSEFFNLFNHVNLATPNASTRRIFDNNGRLSGSAGTITQTTTPSRQIQFGLKYIF